MLTVILTHPYDQLYFYWGKNHQHDKHSAEMVRTDSECALESASEFGCLSNCFSHN